MERKTLAEQPQNKVYYHLPGLFEFFELYKLFIPLFKKHREYFYDWCEIGSIYGAPGDCLWGGGRAMSTTADKHEVFSFMKSNGISARLTLSNSLLGIRHLKDRRCNELVSLFDSSGESGVRNGVILASDLLLKYLQEHSSNLYFVSSTTKTITDFEKLKDELDDPLYSYVVPDFRFNIQPSRLGSLSEAQKHKVELLCNECCPPGCDRRKGCYEDVSKKNLGLEGADHQCKMTGVEGYRFSQAMKNPCFVGTGEIQNVWAPLGIRNFKIEGRGLGSAVVLEMLIYYMVKPEFGINVREEIYLDNMLDLF